MAEKKNLLTAEGKQKLEDELYDLEMRQRPDNIQKIKAAREQGDLSENAEYDAAKERESAIAAQIAEIKNILKNSEVVSDEDIDFDKVYVGCQVTVLELDENVEEIFKIVGSAESNSLINKVSNDSPVGKALMGKSVGDIAEVEAPVGVIRYQVLDIQKAPRNFENKEA